MFNTNYTNVATHSTCTMGMNISVKIDVAGIEEFNDEQQNQISRHCSQIVEELLRSEKAKDPNVEIQKKQVIEKLLECFSEYISFQEMPNQYSNHPVYLSLPWIKVKTLRGYVILGWRKRVISIDWENISDPPDARHIFRNEDVTKEKHLIHAWSYDDAKRYILTILSNFQ